MCIRTPLCIWQVCHHLEKWITLINYRNYSNTKCMQAFHLSSRWHSCGKGNKMNRLDDFINFGLFRNKITKRNRRSKHILRLFFSKKNYKKYEKKYGFNKTDLRTPHKTGAYYECVCFSPGLWQEEWLSSCEGQAYCQCCRVHLPFWIGKDIKHSYIHIFTLRHTTLSSRSLADVFPSFMVSSAPPVKDL